MSNQNFTTHKFVAVLNKKIEPGKAMNAVAHMSLAIVAGAREEEKQHMGFIDYVDADGNLYKNFSKNSFVIVRADNSN